MSQDNTTYIQRIDSLEKDLQSLQGNNNNQLLSMQSQMSQSNSVVTVSIPWLWVDSAEPGAAAGTGEGTDSGVGGEQQGQEWHEGALDGGREREAPWHHYAAAGRVGEARPGGTVHFRTGGLLPAGPGRTRPSHLGTGGLLPANPDPERPSAAAGGQPKVREQPHDEHGVQRMPAVQCVPLQPVPSLIL